MSFSLENVSCLQVSCGSADETSIRRGRTSKTAKPEMTSHLSIVREWQANCSELMTHTNDEIVPVIRSALEVIHAASRAKYEPERADRANAALREHIQKTMGKENGRKPLRVIYFGLLESLLVAMEALAKKRTEEQRFLPVESPSISVVDLEEELLREPFIAVPETVRSTDDEEESQSASVDRAAAAAAPMLLTVKTEKKSPDELASINWGPSNPSAGKKEKAPEKTREGPAPPPVEVLMEQTKNNEKERERAAVEEEEEEEEMDVVVDAPEPKRRGRPPKSKKTGRPKSSGVSTILIVTVAPILAPLLATTLPPSSTISPPPSSSSALTVSDARRPKRVCSQSINFAELNKGTAALGRLKSPDATRKISRQRKASKGGGIPKTTEAKGSVAREAGGVAKRPEKITGSAAKDAKRARVKEEPEPEHEPEEREQSMGYAGSVYSDSGLMNCLLCALGMDSVRAYVDHLRTAHKTTATLEGIWFRCECGHMCRSNSHEANKQPQCGGRRSTIMLDGDEDDYEEVYVEDEVKHEPMDQPEREDASAGDMMEKEEQEEGTCTICKKGRLLYCACGWGIRSARSVRLHNAKRRWCDGRSFRVARLADEPPEPAMSEPEPETNEDREEESSTDQSDWNADSTDRDVVARMEAGEDPGAGIETGAGEKDGVPGEEEEMVEDDDESSGDALLDGDDDGHQPKCFLCEDRPSSIMDFILHLYKVHDSTLGKFGYALQCDCGHVVHSQYAGEEVPRHTKTGKCAGHKFRIKKVPEEAEAQEDEREEDDEAPGPSTGPPPGPPSFANFSLA
ncbi:hypothetical protein PRIPAC_76655 [Pristionchus pacificus]|uniref:Uncharacterized protein n=1 Tax=Pristionchus pacificus TaxID=54126 RepID=A0A2A6C5B9_PRIPA|nr:hypothetical protein PRIPAC_76655 [Pristionchus pacificus]|eukprot:PDM73307.1 hypothetical protein PRIPAC_40663 [Pristionchus pacificus]